MAPGNFPPRPSRPGQKPAFPPPAAPAQERVLDQTSKLMAAVFGEPCQETTSLQAIFKALDRPHSRIVVELPWYKDGSTHQIILKARAGNRISFYNPMGHGDSPAGAELTDGLKRRVEQDGTESCELSALEMLFRLGKARALISPPLT